MHRRKVQGEPRGGIAILSPALLCASLALWLLLLLDLDAHKREVGEKGPVIRLTDEGGAQARQGIFRLGRDDPLFDDRVFSKRQKAVDAQKKPVSRGSSTYTPFLEADIFEPAVPPIS